MTHCNRFPWVNDPGAEIDILSPDNRSFSIPKRYKGRRHEKGDAKSMWRIVREDAEQLYRAHADYVRNVAYFLCQSRSLADDITQETFLRAFRSYHRYNPERPIRPWIHQIAVNVTKSALRRSKGGVMPVPSELRPEVEDFEDDSAVDPLQHALLNERQHDLWREMNHLSLKSREILILRYFAELKVAEIALYLGIPENTCKSRINSALASLRKRYVGDDGEWNEGSAKDAQHGE